MEPAETPIEKRFRYKLVLGKHPVVKIEPVLDQLVLTVQINAGVSFKMGVPQSTDVRLGDLLTIYTEVLTKENADGQTIKAPIQ